MDTSEPVARLRRTAEALLDVSSPIAALEAAASDLHALCSDVTGIGDGPEGEGSAATVLPTGRALSPLEAGGCVKDAQRTAVFLRGVRAAILAAAARRGGGPLEVLYAGTGPFAPLVLPLLACGPPRGLRLTLVDVHERSVRALARLVGAFGFGAFVRELVACDATRYEHPAGTPPDVVVVEAMQRSLCREPHVAIARNLAKQLAPDGVLVPERVVVELILADLSAATSRPASPPVRVGTVFELTRESAAAPREPVAVVTVPPSADPSLLPMLATRVEVFAPHALGAYESGLTIPEVLWSFPRLAGGERFAFRYETGPDPGLVWKSVSA